MSLARNSFVPNKDAAANLPSHKLGSAGTLALYGMTDGGDGSVEISSLPEGTELSASSRDAHGLDGGRENVKFVVSLTKGGGV